MRSSRRKSVSRRRRSRRHHRRQRGGAKHLISGAEFKALCKYNLNDRYPIVPYDGDRSIAEGDRVFLSIDDIDTKFLAKPPTKKLTLVFHNNDREFDDSHMDKVKEYALEVYALNCSAAAAKQIPLGFRDDMYTPHKVLYDVLNDTTKSSDRTTLCLVNFNIETNGGERTMARDSFKDKSWATLSEIYMNLNHEKSKAFSDPEFKKNRVEYYAHLKSTKFVICPPGTGKDTHRVYEALFFGAIPVIKSSFLDPMYNRLGINGCWIVKEWSEVTEEECNKRWEGRVQATIDFTAEKWLN